MLKRMRIILFAGKGGVGKTSVSAATGLELARRGYRTLVMSVDPAHSLSDSFDLDRRLLDQSEGRLTRIRNNLWIQEVDIQEEIQRHWREVHGYISSLLNVSGLNEILAEELAIFPGMEEVSSLMYVNQYLRDNRFDVILLDCAPTGESLRFISMPTTLEWYMNKIFTVQRGVARMVRPMLSSFTSIPLPGDDYFANLESLYEKLRGVDRVLVDPNRTTVRLVTNPEKVVLRETQRAFMYFSLYGMTIDAVIVNRILPREVRDDFFTGWKDLHQRYVASVEDMFAPVPIWKLPLFDSEILGVRELDRVAKALYGSRDPVGVHYHEAPYKFAKVNGTYQVRLKLPFADCEDVDLYQRFDELIVRVGSYKRHVALPQRLANRAPSSAKIQGSELVINFGKGMKDGQQTKASKQEAGA
jgi:arsenite-transporting ATPase